jgi:hypothetical protein
MVSPSTSTSAAPEPVLLITVPFLINVFMEHSSFCALSLSKGY